MTNWEWLIVKALCRLMIYVFTHKPYDTKNDLVLLREALNRDEK